MASRGASGRTRGTARGTRGTSKARTPAKAAGARTPTSSKASGRHAKAVAHLRDADPVLRRVLDAVGPCRLEPPAVRDDLGALVRAIVFQQLAGAAARTIHGRVVTVLGEGFGPRRLLEADEAAMRGAGLSGGKLASLRDLGRACVEGRLGLPVADDLSDEEVTARLTVVRGIGPWTAHMFLMFHLGRPDVFPVGDLGVRTAMKKAYRWRGPITARRMERTAQAWRPHRSVAAWYLWRTLDTSDGS